MNSFINYALADNKTIMTNQKYNDDRLECHCWKIFNQYEMMNRKDPECNSCRINI